jgi:UDP-N-acetylmuramate dehydrogenase
MILIGKWKKMKNTDRIIEYSKLKELEFEENASLSEYTTFKIGGKVPLIVKPNSRETLIELIQLAKKKNVPYYILGKGSNILAGKVDGLIIRLSSAFSETTVDNNTITACSGASLSSLCKTARNNELTGLEFAYGIPGTIGGAVCMNAGAYGGEIKDVIVNCECLDLSGGQSEIVTIPKPDLELSYRHSIFSVSPQNRELVILSVKLSLKSGEKFKINAKMNDIKNKRRDKQPLDFPSAGSTFKRPPNDFAARLIEQCGLKGAKTGGAEVSEKHAGFVINTGNATYGDVIELTEKIKKTVLEKTGVSLEREIELWNF